MLMMIMYSEMVFSPLF